ncbi:preprotein translocase subunit SecE [Longirhabdus pacifica]|uniref:preprotein translocase subunit SecE n=1 Tax=Longirhabdus pacifica TaxID=2305227 RepID=UPI00100876DC|nr:preprotein translocase subunit SecE [Longirhabdus pacifica]
MAILGKVKNSFGSMFSFFANSWAELKKVRWPKRKELISYTIVVLVTVAIVTVYFTIVDFGLNNLIDALF